ncbi:MAG TPA: autotransporter-associated beta strand repeat-containing protein, partial [Verrucomicrobiae bacterium]
MRFFGNTSYFSTNDLAALPFQLFGMVFNNSGAATSGVAANISGNALEFQGDAGNPAITSSGASLVNIANDISTGGGATNLVLGGNGGVVTLSGIISGSANLTKSGNHTNFLTSGNNTYSGDTVVTAGLLVGLITNNNVTPFGRGALRLQGGTLSLRADGITNVTPGGGSGYNVIQASNSTGTLNADRFAAPTTNVVYHLNNLSLSNATLGLTSGNGGSIQFEGGISLGGTTAVFNASSGTHVLNGPISESTAGVSLRKIGGARLILNTNGNSIGYTGNTLIDAGQLQVLFTTNNNAPLPGSTLYLRGGTLEVRVTNNLIVGPGAGYDFLVTSNGSTINVDRNTGSTNGTNTVTLNNIFFTNNTLFGQNSTNVGTNLSFTTGNADSIDVRGTIRIASNTLFTVSSNTFFNGLVTESGPGSGGYYLRKFGVGRLFITNGDVVSNTWLGGTVIDQGQLQVNATSNNPANLGPGDLTLRGGTLEIRASNSLVFGPGAAGYSVTLVSNSTINVDRSDTASVSNTIDMNALVIAGNTNGSGTNLTVSGANNYSLRFTGPVTLAGTNGSLTPTTNLIINGLISETGGSQSLNKAGAGRLFLTNGVDHEYTGGTYISAGPLQVNLFTNNATTLGPGAITLRGGTLELRSDTNNTFGAGSGYSATNLTSSTISVDRITTNGLGNTVFLNTISITTNSTLTVNGANGFTLSLKGPLDGPGYSLPSSGPGIVSNNVINTLGGGFLLFSNSFAFYGDNIISGIRFDGGITLDGRVSISNASGTVFLDG